MISSEVHRTLVKSPPELWTELSDPAALARHLGEFGEIRITRSEPEQIVEWEGDRARGRVLLKPSGWGTKVTLTVTGELANEDPPEPDLSEETPAAPAPEAPAAEAHPDPTPETPAAPAPEAPAAEAHPDPTPETPAVPAPEAPAAEVHPDLEHEISAESHGQEEEQEEAPVVTVPSQPERKRGFLARLFGRGAPEEPAPSDDPAVPLGAPTTFAATEADPATDTAEPTELVERTDTAEPIELAERTDTAEPIELVEPTGAAFGLFEATEPAAAIEPVEALEPSPEGTPEGAPRVLGTLAAELQTAEEAAVVQVTMVLTSVLDRLGSAHHRPFSRS
jgi:hypothetical protein